MKLQITIIFYSLTMLLLGYYHNVTGGFRVDSFANGEILFSNDLFSSGGDDSTIFWVFIIPFFISFFVAAFSLVICKPAFLYLSFFLYVVIVLFYGFGLFIVNIDTNLINSIQLGDFILIALLIIPFVPVMHGLLYLFRKLKLH